MEIANQRVHRIIIFAFLGNPLTDQHVFDCSVLNNIKQTVLIDYFNRYGTRKQEEPQIVEQDENGRVNYTLGYITKLAEGEVFVFGSNLAGMHGGGAAATAHRCFGAIWEKA